ncbi:MAG: tRNA (adenosine(37)-N6)-threonylcarbamoyltransferase complex dimerization subunit type 1 TsaB [bacterium]
MILTIDTTSEKVQVAILQGADILEVELWSGKNNHSETLLPEIDNVLHRLNLKTSDLKGIAVVNGPGNYTGLRVGVATANALSFALQIPLYAVNRFQLLFEHVDDVVDTLFVITAVAETLYIARSISKNDFAAMDFKEIKNINPKKIVGDLILEQENLLAENLEDIEIKNVKTYNLLPELASLIQNEEEITVASPLYIKKPAITKGKEKVFLDGKIIRQ